MLTVSDLLGVTAALVREAKLAPPLGLVPLEGGKNNRVFRVDLQDGHSLVLKSYFADPRDPRDRLGAEWDFLTYAWSRGNRDVPEPVAHRRDLHLGLYGFIPGRKLAAAEAGETHVGKAADFIIALNKAPREPMSLAPGSEACFSIAEHIAMAERRVARLAALSPAPEFRATADAFVAARLIPAWRRTKDRLNEALRIAGLEAGTLLEAGAVIVSPSDFGFHNALFDEKRGHLRFIDFEYAGHDDPAKLVCDFFCQPEIPAPASAFEWFLDRVFTGLDLADVHRDRCRLLLDLYRVKWAAITLNQFMPLDAARRAFAGHETSGARQIARAEAQIAAIAV